MSFNPLIQSPLQRLCVDGQIDETYTPEDMPTGDTIYAVALRTNGRVIAAGLFNQAFNTKYLNLSLIHI